MVFMAALVLCLVWPPAGFSRALRSGYDAFVGTINDRRRPSKRPFARRLVKAGVFLFLLASFVANVASLGPAEVAAYVVLGALVALWVWLW